MEISGVSIFDTWQKSIELLINSSTILPTERSGDTFELQNCVLKSTNPLYEIDKIKEFDSKRNVDYYASDRVRYWETVSKRLLEFETYNNTNINQIESIINKLSTNWFNRQAYATIWSPAIDTVEERPMCILGVYFCIRDDKLNMTSILRSNDAWGQALDDIYHLFLIQKRVSKILNVPVGTYSHIALSYHLYTQDVIKARLFLEGKLYERT